MSTTENSKKTNKNILYIGVISLIFVIAIIAIIATKCKKDDTTKENKVPVIAINSENGDEEATIKADITLPPRKFKFTESMGKIMKSESKREDTLDLDKDYEPAKSSDGYTYIMYDFNNSSKAEFFGTHVDTSDNDAGLTYVFYKDKLTEVRVEYGSIGLDAFDDIVENISSSYGQPTYSRLYSDGTQESWWKTNKVMLDIICEDEKVIVYYRENK